MDFADQADLQLFYIILILAQIRKILVICVPITRPLAKIIITC
jgi:hypothetical protein